ncbi:probable autoinducer 2 sensor kinase/phosphatase luxQ [Rhynchosporium graminicola]|uniref:histidine kinase n=1 Tax=Rhynchosporium graminicola TaxID=2792576 RepID=A0A1E1KEH6_9HELO|nr:probable autoinducer 2 sensor kinase/phosphatase luxQ [Rhynchosporium commune]
MPPPSKPRSPLDNPSSSHSRRPSNSRRTSSEKSATKSSKHGIIKPSSSSASPKPGDLMADLPLSAKSPPHPDGGGRETKPTGTSNTPVEEYVEGVQSVRGIILPPGSEVRSKREANAEGRHAGFQIPENTSHEEVERLRTAMNAQLQLAQHRDRLARQLGTREEKGASGSFTPSGKSRVSPIHEETISPSLDAAFETPPSAGLETASTESVRTVRGGMTPGLVAARTPSYPFPSMRTPGHLSFSGHRPFTSLSPTVNPSNYAGGSFDPGVQDRVLSRSVTPASTMRFQPPGSSESQEDPVFESPNLYELSLMLSAEPGLEPWWNSVVQMMRTLYQAHRVTLSVPADTTDIENVPWGQKATFNAAEEDGLSLGYLPRGSSLVPSSVDTNDTSNSEDTGPPEGSVGALAPGQHAALRPGILSRHSFTAYEDTKRDPVSNAEINRVAAPRPSSLARAKSYLSTRPDMPPRTATLQNAELNLQSLRDHVAFEEAKEPSNEWETRAHADREVNGRIFTVLQALDYEAEPLIDNKGVLRVLERGKVIALTRDYPYVESSKGDEKSGGSKSSSSLSQKSKDSPSDNNKSGKPSEISTRISSFFGGRTRRSSRGARSSTERGGVPDQRTANDREFHAMPRYEEYEQAPQSPWAQSPAPSPAVRVETSENPFFSGGPVDEETFNPQTSAPDYTDMPPTETIGLDRSWTVLHIPLVHPLLSKPVQAFRLDAAAMESRTAKGKGVDSTLKGVGIEHFRTKEESKGKQSPIAILSILSPVIPYPSTLRHSLEHLAPHLATSFSLCRHFSNLETEIAGLSRKRPQTTGFGAVAGGHDDRLRSALPAYSPIEETLARHSTGGSITSPSDYSGVSRSTLGSPPGTPGWDPGSVGLTMEKRSSGESPSYMSGESYFSSRARPGVTRIETGSASSITGARRASKESSPADTRSQRYPRTSGERRRDTEAPGADTSDDDGPEKSATQEETSTTITPKQEHHPRPSDSPENRDVSPSRQGFESQLSPRRLAMRTASNQGPGKADRQHTQLHSYGADFSATFQSLPTPSSKGPAAAKPKSRSDSLSVQPDYMPPPSDRVKGIMLDSLPLHIFIALPPTGEMVWVNSRYLTYRGQSVKDLHEDPWASIHPEEREEYLKAWAHAIRTGEQFSMQVQLKRFDGTYRWFYTRAVGLRDSRGVIVQWYGTHMDIHDQHIAEVKAARQEEIEASEAKHRQLANLIPQIIFSATEEDGVTFANQQWLSYTGQDFESSLGLGFMDYVHPEDLAKCHIPINSHPAPTLFRSEKPPEPSRNPSHSSSGGQASVKSNVSSAPTERTIKAGYQPLSRTNSSSSGSLHEFPNADFSELMKAGVIKVEMDGNGRTSYSTEVRLRSKSGEYRWHLVRCVEVDNINLGSKDGSWFGACADINDHKLLEMKLKEAMESKGKFLSNMSHEIRTPLIGISGMISFLQDTPLNDEQIDYCNTIASSADGLLNIINDILDLAKADAGMMKLSYDWFHTRSLVEEVNEMISTIAITKHLEVNYVVDVDVPEMVKGDRFRIRQVLLNVIGNAIKFTTVGEVFSRCRVVRSETAEAEDNEVMLEFSIIDTGRGFTQEEAELIFKPFSQIDASSTRTHGGTGLGLVISRQLVELHGGQMEGTAEPGKGSTFTFTAVFQLPTDDDHPEPPSTPALSTVSSTPSTRLSLKSQISYETTVRAIRQAGGNPILANRLIQSPMVESPRTESSGTDPVPSSGSSNPSTHSARSPTTTQRSSSSSTSQSLAHFSEAAKVIAPDPSSMKLELPGRTSSGAGSTSDSQDTTPTPTNANLASMAKHVRPPMYSILIICPQKHSREATTQHIEMTLPKDVPHQITGLASVDEARAMIGGEDPVIFTHIVLNLGSAEDIVALIDQIVQTLALPRASIVVLTDPVQRQEVIRSTGSDYTKLTNDSRLTFVYKPVKPSRFAVIFDPEKERDLSTDRNRFSAQQQVANARQNYLDIGKRLGNKGHRVLLVEDNATNQKVLMKYLSKVGIAVDLALDGVECTEQVFGKPHSFYSLILCDLHMPNKDGYQACREIREWEQKGSYPRMPIIALSANVMADVLEKCIDAGFSNYITKPVDFKALSALMGDLLDPTTPATVSKTIPARETTATKTTT